MKHFISCLGIAGTGKSTFGSNYYKKLYNVKNDYFERSDQSLSFTKGIWMISDEERRKIPQYITKDILDVEGFQVDQINSWKYVMIIAFLSSELIIFKGKERFDDVGKIIKIIQIGLKKMKKLNMPRILKIIYIQTTIKEPIEPIEKLLEKFKYDKNIFNNIKFKYIYLPQISISGKNQELMKYKDYNNAFEEILKNLLNVTYKYNSVSSLKNYIDSFNLALNGNIEFYNQQIFKDIEIDFDGIYSKKEEEKKKN